MSKRKIKRGAILKNIKIEKIGGGGVGVSTFLDGKKIIISGGVLPNSVVNCRVIKNKKDYIQCQLLDYVELPENLNLKDLCKHNMIFKYFGKLGCDVGCGGCKWQVLPYDEQLKLKQQLFEDSFRFIYDKVSDKINYILKSPVIFGYRNKVEFSLGYCKDFANLNNLEKLPTIGFHRQGRWDEVVDVEECKLISEKANEVYKYIKKLIKNSELPNYDQRNHQGVFRHLVIRYGFNTGEILANLVIATENDLARKYENEIKNFIDLIRSDNFINKNVTTFIVTYNNGLADVVRSQDVEVEVLYGRGYIYEILKIFDIDVKFRVSPFSFFQTNTLGAQLLFGKAIEFLKSYGKEKYNTILDLYCGTGTIGLIFLKLGLGNNLIGVELLKEAIDDAYINAKINNLDGKVYFNFGKAEQIIWNDKKIKDNLENIDLVIVDPPRDGLHKNVVKFLVNLKKKIDFHLLYISCNPITLARDIDMLLSSGKFNLQVLQPVDMFPHTHHIETISILK